MVHLAHLIVLGGVRRARDRPTIDDTDVDVALADVDRAHLLIGDRSGDSLEVVLDLVVADVSRRTLVARRLRRILWDRDRHQGSERGDDEFLHGDSYLGRHKACPYRFGPAFAGGFGVAGQTTP